MRRAATDVLGERGHVLEPPADLLAVQVDAGATDGHQLKLMLRRRHAGRPLPDRRRPSPAMNVKYILFLHSKQYTFHFRARLARSEEHTSELQSLMRTSYAVFCLKKKKYNIKNISQHEKNRTKKRIKDITTRINRNTL